MLAGLRRSLARNHPSENALGISWQARRCYDAVRDRQTMPDTTRLITAEELERFPGDDNRYELVEGRVIRMSPVGYRHARVVTPVPRPLESSHQWTGPRCRPHRIGIQARVESGHGAGPGQYVVRRDRVPAPDTRGFLNGPPGSPPLKFSHRTIVPVKCVARWSCWTAGLRSCWWCEH